MFPDEDCFGGFEDPFSGVLESDQTRSGEDADRALVGELEGESAEAIKMVTCISSWIMEDNEMGQGMALESPQGRDKRILLSLFQISARNRLSKALHSQLRCWNRIEAAERERARGNDFGPLSSRTNPYVDDS